MPANMANTANTAADPDGRADLRTLRDVLRPEAELLILLARPDLGEPVRERVREVLGKDPIDWGFFLDQAARQGVLPLVSGNLVRWRLTHGPDGTVLVPYRWLYADVYHGNRRRNLALFDEFAVVFTALNRAGLDVLVRKGPAITERIYRDPGLRRMADLDLFMHRSDFPRFGAILEELGYRMGTQSPNGRVVLPFGRSEELYWKVSLRNVSLPYLKLAHHDEVESFILSGCFSLFQPMSGIEDDFSGFLARSVQAIICGAPIRRLDPVDEVLDLCLQVHVEATLLYYIESHKDLTLRKFLDVALCVSRLPHDSGSELLRRTQDYGCRDSVYFALHHTATVYPGYVPLTLLESARPSDLGYLDEYGAFDGRPARWGMPLLERLFDAHRDRLVADRSAVPGPRSSI
ncbi:MAG: nucleotidyltransferase domain-containing protein [Pseudonocardiaceae bacterium]